MKKKLLWIAALLAALALLVTGCPTGGGDDDDDDDDDNTTEFWVAKNDTGEKLGDGKTKTLVGQTEDNYVHIFFTPLGKSFDKIKINFTYGGNGIGFNMCWQCAYDDNGTWGQSGSDYIDWLETGPIEVDPSVMFKTGWGTIANGATALDKASMKGICLRVTVADGDPDATFTLTSVEFVGSGSGGSGNGGGSGSGTGETVEATHWYLSGTEHGSAATDNAVTGTGNEWYIYIYFDANANLNDVILTFTVTGATITKQCVYDGIGTWGWGWGDVTSGSNFDLSGGSSWYGHESGVTLDKATLNGICLKMTGAGTFTLTKVELVK